MEETMPNLTIPVDGRPQFDPGTVMLANYSLGRWPLTAGVETVTPGGSYILKNSWPTPPITNSNFSSSVAASVAPAGTKPRTAAQALWPNLPSAG
jgi:hypothetical protein